MEFGESSIEKKLQDYKLLKAKYERQEKALINDSVFRKKSSNSPKKHWIYKHIHPFFLYIMDLMMYIIVIGCLNKAINAISRTSCSGGLIWDMQNIIM